MTKPKLHKEIIAYLKSQKKDLKEELNKIKDDGLENMNYEECENYGFFLGQLSKINELLQIYGK